MSDLAATNCGNSCGGNGCSNIILILLLLCCCGGEHGFFRGDGCGCGGNFFGGDEGNCSWLIILLLIFCCGGC